MLVKNASESLVTLPLSQERILSAVDLEVHRFSIKVIEKSRQRSESPLVVKVAHGESVLDVSVNIQRTFKAIFPKNKQLTFERKKADVESYLKHLREAESPQDVYIPKNYSAWKVDLKRRFKIVGEYTSERRKDYKMLKEALAFLDQVLNENKGIGEIACVIEELRKIHEDSIDLNRDPDLHVTLNQMGSFCSFYSLVLQISKSSFLDKEIRERLLLKFVSPHEDASPVNVGEVEFSYNYTLNQGEVAQKTGYRALKVEFSPSWETVLIPSLSSKINKEFTGDGLTSNESVELIKKHLERLEHQNPNTTRFSRRVYPIPFTCEKTERGYLVIPKLSSVKGEGVLGQGVLKTVKAGFFIPYNGKPLKVAISTIDDSNEYLVSKIVDRVKSLEALNSPFSLAAPLSITKAHRTSKSTGNYRRSLVFPFFDMNVSTYLANKPKAVDLLKIAYYMSKGLEHIHAEGYVHGDIKPDNILLSLEGEKRVAKAVIADFDEAFKEGSRHVVSLATPAYLPRSHIRFDEKGRPVGYRSEMFSRKTDMFSLGACLVDFYVHANSLLSVPGYKSLQLELTHADPSERPTAADTSRRLKTMLDHLKQKK